VRDKLDEVAVVVMLITTAAELLPGVIGLGVKLHSETAGAPEHDRVTALLKEAPTGSTLKL
jgi:hypothetical protein